ncbi:MAG: hypothetical protein MI757_21505 [Pirellulales bacterium]|nr:hypothetical protein [Pirellulales bacterium]
MEDTSREDKGRELDELRQRVASLEAALAEPPKERWQATGYYPAYSATAGFMLGSIAAGASLLLNVVGSLIVGKPALWLIQVYLTFPLGARALTEDFAKESGMIIAIGCCLYLGTGMLLGIVFQLALARLAPPQQVPPLAKRIIASTVLAALIWVVNFYFILSWLQPALFGGNWIVELVPWWVGLLTHLVFGWTMALVYPLGKYTPYELQTER